MRKRTKAYQYAAAFLLPVVCFALLCAFRGIYPFGALSNYWEDLEFQYSDFFCYWKDVLSGQAGADYSFSKSLGGSTTALAAYYLMSPLNLLLVLFRKDQMQLFLYVVTSLKLGLCGLCFCVYASRRFKLSGGAAAGLSLAYAFTQYGVGQSANIMWLDGVYMLPLVMLGVYRYVAEGKRTPLYAAVACSVVFNWYTGYMNCLFAAVYFVFEMILHERSFSPRRLLRRTVGFGMTGLFGVLLSGTVFLPAVVGQRAGESIDAYFFGFAVNGGPLDALNWFLIGSAFPSEQITLFCTTAVLLAFFSFWFLKNVPGRVKAAAGLLAAVMAASLYFEPLECIWCGFKFEHSYQYRFAYTATAAIAVIAALALERLRDRGARGRSLCRGAAVFAAVLLLSACLNGLWPARLWVQIGLIAAYVGLGFAADRAAAGGKRAVLRAAAACAAVLYLGEVLANAALVQGNRNVFDAAHNSDYAAAQQRLADALRPEDTEFYRIEQTAMRGGAGNVFYANEALAYDFAGIQSYTSCYDSAVADMLIRAGYCAVEIPSVYKAPILPVDSFLGVRYLLSDRDWAGFEKTDMPGANGKDVYQNPYALPFGFGAADGADEPVEGETFDYANGLYSAVLGERTEVFREAVPSSVERSGGDVTYRFDAAGGDGPLYMTFDTRKAHCGEVLVDGVSLGGYDKDELGDEWAAFDKVFYLGRAGGIEEVTLLDCSSPAGEPEARFCYADTDALAAAAGTLRDRAVETREVRDGYVRASYTAPEAGQVLLTIPYEKGWRAAVNGQSVQLLQGAGIFTLVPVQAGENEIVLEYTAGGRTVGMALSALSLLLFAAWGLYDRKKRREAEQG